MTDRELLVDFETRGTVELKDAGVHKYAPHRHTSVWCMAYAFADEDPALWWPEREPMPEPIKDHVRGGGLLRAWNAEFERVMWRECLHRLYPDVPVPALEQWRDTMADAAAMALPRKLEQCAQVLNCAQRKDDAGHRLMLQLCKPRRYNEDGEPVWWDAPEKVSRLGAYCQQDVRTERAVGRATRRLPPSELALWHLDQRINDRGIAMDTQLAAAAQQVAADEVQRQNALLSEATDGAVGEVTKVAKLKEWLASQGVLVDSLAKAAVRDMLAPGHALSPEVAEALGIRQEAAKSSIAKLEKMFDGVSIDGRLRGLLQYHAASTGRWGGRRVQPHNFPRGQDVENAVQYIPCVLGERPWPEGLPKLSVIAALLRAVLVAGPGKTLVCADFSGIELRVLAWLAGQDDLVSALANGDKKTYHRMGAKIFNRPVEQIIKPSNEYTIAKNTVLGCGFGMGAKKFVTQIKKDAGLDVSEELAKTAVDAYRSGYPCIPAYWNAVNDAAVGAVAKAGEPRKVGAVTFVVRGNYLWIVLPSRRVLAYAQPKLVDRDVPWGGTRVSVAFSGMNGYTHQWERMHLYGGLITENIVQAVARDLLAASTQRTEAADFPTVVTVHDEIVAEVGADDGEARFPVFLNLMRQTPEWAKGCPVDAEGWHGHRYRK